MKRFCFLWRTTTNVTWAQDVSEPLQICLFKRSKLSSGKTWVSLARQFHLPLLVKESIAGWDCPVGHSCVQEANFCCPCKLLPSSHPHCGCQRHNLSLGFPHFLLNISLSRISCLFLCDLQQRITRVWGFKVRFSFVSSTQAPRTGMGCVLFAPAKQRKTKFQFWKTKSWTTLGAKICVRPECKWGLSVHFVCFWHTDRFGLAAFPADAFFTNFIREGVKNGYYKTVDHKQMWKFIVFNGIWHYGTQYTFYLIVRGLKMHF